MKRSLYFISLFSFVLMLSISSIFAVSFNEKYFMNRSKKLDITETISVDEETLMDVSHVLFDYIKGHEDTLDYPVVIENKEVEFFNEKEKDHMVDVQNLYGTTLMVRNLSLFVSLLGLVGLIVTKDYQNLNLMHEVLGKVLLAYGFIVGSVLIAALLDFDFFWTTFHELVFTNDLWLLNPMTDRLIMMVPLEFFMGLVYRIFGLLALIFSALFGLFKITEKKVSL